MDELELEYEEEVYLNRLGTAPNGLYAMKDMLEGQGYEVSSVCLATPFFCAIEVMPKQ